MKDKKTANKRHFLSPLASSFPLILSVGTLSILLSLFLIYTMHPYISLLAMVGFAAFLFELSTHAPSQGYQKIAAGTFAVATFVLMFALPSGELGFGSCPEKVIGSGAVTVKYFQSPFCQYCVLYGQNIIDAQKESGFRLEYYDLRYCSREASKFGFYATPCFAFVGPQGTKRACGVLSSEQIVAASMQVA